MPTGPGKFEGEGFETFALHCWSLNGFTDDQAGTVDDIGWHGRFDNVLVVDEDTIAEGKAEGYTDDEVKAGCDALIRSAGAILLEDSQGFVSSVLFEDSNALEEVWSDIVARDLEGGEDDA